MQCGTDNSPEAKFCSACGAALQGTGMVNESVSFPNETRSETRAERRQLTVLFCDLVGSTSLSEKLDPEEYRRLIKDYHRVAAAVVEKKNGHIAQYLGDGLLVYFGYPVGLEDASIVAVRAGLGILEEVAQANLQWMEEGRAEVKVRIGIHTGLVVVDENMALGETVNVASRLEGLAPHNGVVISPNTLHLVQGWFDVKSMGKQTLKGISQPIEIFHVVKERAVQTRLDVAKARGLSPLVGREKELAFLHEKWEQAKKGKGNLVLINGEAGIGKTRLVYTLEQQKDKTQEYWFTIARCSPDQINSAFSPIINWLEKQLLLFEPGETTASKIKKAETFLDQSGIDAESFLPLLAEFLSVSSDEVPPLIMSPFAKRQRMMEMLNQVVIQNAAARPVLLIIEDLHWADSSTLEWLKQFLEKLPAQRIFIIGTTRPGFHPDWMEHQAVSQLEVHRLSAGNVAAICLHQTKGKKIPAELLKQINAKTEGVPLFVEELTKMVLESGMLVEKEDGFELAGDINSLSIPSTLQDSLLARLDRLSPVKGVIEVGAVLGREFSFTILQAVTEQDSASLKKALSQLVDAEFLFEQEKSDGVYYLFKHALIQDTAYESMLKSRRYQLHQQAAHVLEEQFPLINDTHPELLAHHYTKAGLPLKAIPLWLKAGQAASRQNASFEAIAHLEKGLELLPQVKAEAERKNLELDFQLTLGGTFVIAYGFPHPKVKETFDKAREIAQTIELSPKLALIFLNLSSYYFNTEDFHATEELHAYAKKLEDDPQNGYWFRLLEQAIGFAGVCKGEFEKANLSFERVLEIYDPALPFPWELAPSGHIEVGAKSWWMICLQILGYVKEAKALSDHHLEYAGIYKDSMTLYHIYTFPALYNLFAKDRQAVQKIIDLYMPVVKEFGDPVFMLTADVYYALAKAFEGDRESFDKAKALHNVCFEIGFKTFAVCMCGWIAELYYMYKEYETGLSWIDKMLAHVYKTGSHIQTAELYRVKGMIQKELGEKDSIVEEQFKNALALAGKQSAKMFELRTAVQLSQLWEKIGRKKEAKAVLQEVYNWFPPDFSSADLDEAKAVLDRI